MTNTAAISLRRTERTISFTLTLARPGVRHRPRRKAEPRRERPFGLAETSCAVQKPQI